MSKFGVFIKKVIAGIAIAVFVMGEVSTVDVQAATQSRHYVAFGDSITAGKQSYVTTVGNELRKKNPGLVTINLGRGGWTSGNLLDALTNTKHPDYWQFQYYIKNAEYITLDIGSNDFFKTVEQVYADSFGCDKTAVWDKIDGLCARMRGADETDARAAYFEARVAAEKIHNELYYGDSIKNAMKKYQENYEKILNIFEKGNPKAKVFIGTLYNPYVGGPSMMLGDYEIVNMDKYTDKYVHQVNQFLRSNSRNHKVVDLYSVLSKGDKYFYGEYEYLNYDPHPNPEGQAIIAKQFINAMR